VVVVLALTLVAAREKSEAKQHILNCNKKS